MPPCLLAIPNHGKAAWGKHNQYILAIVTRAQGLIERSSLVSCCFLGAETQHRIASTRGELLIELQHCIRPDKIRFLNISLKMYHKQGESLKAKPALYETAIVRVRG